MKKLVLFSALLFFMITGFSQEPKEYATLRYSNNSDIISLYKETGSQSFTEFKSTKPKLTDAMTVLNSLSKNGWKVIEFSTTNIYNSPNSGAKIVFSYIYLLERIKE